MNIQEQTAAPFPVWARKSVIQQITGCPDKWIYGFAAKHRDDIRKFGGGGKNGTLIFRVSAVLRAIDESEDIGDAEVAEGEAS